MLRSTSDRALSRLGELYPTRSAITRVYHCSICRRIHLSQKFRYSMCSRAGLVGPLQLRGHCPSNLRRVNTGRNVCGPNCRFCCLLIGAKNCSEITTFCHGNAKLSHRHDHGGFRLEEDLCGPISKSRETACIPGEGAGGIAWDHKPVGPRRRSPQL